MSKLVSSEEKRWIYLQENCLFLHLRFGISLLQFNLVYFPTIFKLVLSYSLLKSNTNTKSSYLLGVFECLILQVNSLKRVSKRFGR